MFFCVCVLTDRWVHLCQCGRCKDSKHPLSLLCGIVPRGNRQCSWLICKQTLYPHSPLLFFHLKLSLYVPFLHRFSLECVDCIPMVSKLKIHILFSQPITRRSLANSFHKLSMNSVSIDVIGEFWREMKRENWSGILELVHTDKKIKGAADRNSSENGRTPISLDFLRVNVFPDTDFIKNSAS